jgi:acyl-CoA thioester hydrolase
MKSSVLYRVPYADTDQMNVVYYANYLEYFERARNELLRDFGLSYKDMEAMGFALPVREAKVEYHASAHYDDMLELCAWCEEFKGVRLTIRAEVKRDGKVLADGYTTHVCVDLKTLRPRRPTPELLSRMGFEYKES